MIRYFPHDRYEGYGEDIATEIAAVRERLQTVVHDARAELELTAAKEAVTIVQMDTILQRYRHYPEELDGARSRGRGCH